MSKQPRHILVAIGDIQRPPGSELRKVAALAKASGASVELFHVINEPDPLRSYPETATLEAVKKQRAAIVAKREPKLERFARDPSLRGIKVTSKAAWDHPPHDAIMRRAHASRAELVVAAAHGHRFGARLVLRNTDWELIRHRPVPLLLMKSRRTYQRPVVLAAVDPFHAHAKPAGLDSRLLDAASRFAQLLRGTTHLFHAYMPLITSEPTAIGGVPVFLPPEVQKAHSRQIARTVHRLAERVGIPRTPCHIQVGDVPGEMCTVARRMHAQLVAMAAESRSALARRLLGNTPERVVDELNCDVLVVKPRTSVAKRSPTANRMSVRPRRTVTRASVSRREQDLVPPVL